MADMNTTVSITPADLLTQISLHELCVAAVNKMIEDEVSRHVSFISEEDDLRFRLEELQLEYCGKIPKVTIEWVDESEADPKNFESGITKRAVDGAYCACPVNSADTTLICQRCGLPVSPRN